MRRTGVVALTAAVLFVIVPLVLCAQSYQQLFPLLGALPGWEADEPDGVDMRATGMQAVSAQREYRRGDRKITATIISGQYMATGWNPGFREGFSMQTPDGTIEVKRVAGYLVAHTHDDSDGSGVLMVLLRGDMDTGAVFVMGYDGLDGDEALGLARRFDWGRMKSGTAGIQ